MTTPTPDPGSEMSPEELERLRRELAAPAAPDGVLDRARTSAMAAFDEVHDDANAAPGGVRDIGSARTTPTRTAPWYQRIPLGAAAAIVAVVALVGVFSQIDADGDDADTATSDADDSADDSADGDSGSEFEESSGALEGTGGGSDAAADAPDGEAFGSGGSGGATSGDASTAPPAVLATYDDLDSLVDALRRRYDATETPADETPNETQSSEPVATTNAGRSTDFDREPCDAFAAAEVEPATVLSEEFVALGPDGDRSVAIAVVYDSDDTGLRVAVVDERSCALLDDRAL